MKCLKQLVFISLILLVTYGFGQTPTKPPDPLESGWNVSVNGSYSNITNAASNNGFVTTESIRFATHWNVRSDQFIVLSPSVVIVTAGPEYRFSLAHIFKNASTYAASANKFEAFANVGAGTARSSVQNPDGSSTLSKADFAWKIGGGFDYLVSSNVSVRPLDISYVRAPLLQNGGAVIGNQLQFAAGLGIRF